MFIGPGVVVEILDVNGTKKPRFIDPKATIRARIFIGYNCKDSLILVQQREQVRHKCSALCDKNVF